MPSARNLSSTHSCSGSITGKIVAEGWTVYFDTLFTNHWIKITCRKVRTTSDDHGAARVISPVITAPCSGSLIIAVEGHAAAGAPSRKIC